MLLQQSHFLHKIHSNALPFEYRVLGDNENFWWKTFFIIKLSLSWKWYNKYHKKFTPQINFNSHHLILITKWKNLKQISKKILKNSNYSKVLKLFPNISNFFPDLKFGIFAFSNNEQRQWVQKRQRVCSMLANKAKTWSNRVKALFVVNNSEQSFDLVWPGLVCSLLVTANWALTFFLLFFVVFVQISRCSFEI